MLLIITSTGDELLSNVNGDFEWPRTPKIGGCSEFFSQFWAATHNLRVNCAKMAGDRPRQPASEIFAANSLHSSRPAHGVSKRVPPTKWVFLCYWLV